MGEDWDGLLDGIEGCAMFGEEVFFGGGERG